MPNQTQQNMLVSYKVQSGLGVTATGAGGKGLRIGPSGGLRFSRTPVQSTETRRDGQETRGVHGTGVVPAGTYDTELSVGTLDELFEAILRATATSAASITQATMTSITTTTDTIVAAAGSWLTQGVRRGDMVRLTDHSTAGNNNKWFRVLGVTASTITVPAGSLTLNASADTTFTLTVAKTIISGVAPVERYFTVDEHNQDLDTSLVYSDVKWTKMSLRAEPDQTVKVTFTGMGLRFSTATAGAAPTLTSPTYTTSLPLVMSDGTIRINGTDYADLTGFMLDIDLGGEATPVNAQTAADVFLNNAKVSGSFSGIRSGVTWHDAHRLSTQVELFATFSEAASIADPRPFVSFYVGNALVDTPDGSFGGTGPVIDSVPWRAGKDEAGGDRAATTLKICTSAA